MTSSTNHRAFAKAVVAVLSETGSDGKPRWSKPELRAATVYLLAPLLSELEPILPDSLRVVVGRFLVEHELTPEQASAGLSAELQAVLQRTMPAPLQAAVDEVVTSFFERAAGDGLDAARAAAKTLGSSPSTSYDPEPSDDGVKADPLARFRLRSS